MRSHFLNRHFPWHWIFSTASRKTEVQDKDFTNTRPSDSNFEFYSTVDILEKICNVTKSDHARFCSSVFHVLHLEGYVREGSFRRVNSVRMYDSKIRCLQKIVVLSSYHLIPVRALRCSMNDSKPWHVQFYVLGDHEENHTVFALLPREGSEKEITLTLRVSMVGALLNPEKPGLF